LNSDPKKACEFFYVYAKRLLIASPPYVMKAVPTREQDDAIHDIIVHCVKDNFRVVRTYRNNGKPFAWWLKRVATRKILEWIRSRRNVPVLISAFGNGQETHFEPEDPQPAAPVETKEILRVTNQCIALLALKCQILLRSAAEEFTPREMALMLGLSSKDSKKISDDLRHCRKKLVRLLTERGFDPTLNNL
jgi:RNA polymerase sigma factor (sigma-70 family)